MVARACPEGSALISTAFGIGARPLALVQIERETDKRLHESASRDSRSIET